MAKWDEYLLHSCDDLRKLIIENPDLPLLVFAGENAYSTDCYAYTCTTNVHARIGEVLYGRGPRDGALKEDMVYCEKEDVEEAIEEYLWDNRTDEQMKWTEDRWDEYVQQEINKYAPLWQKCIILYADN